MNQRSISAFVMAAFILTFTACDKVVALRGSMEKEGALPKDQQHEVVDEEAGSHGTHHSNSENPQGEQEHGEGEHHLEHKIVVTSPIAKDVVNTQQYVCQIHSWRHIEVKALEGGYLEEIAVNEGQEVKKGDIIFRIVPTLYQAKLDVEIAEAELAQIELQNTERLFRQNIVSQPEVALARVKLSKAQAMVKLTQAELDFANIKAPFNGIIDKQYEQQGSLIEEGAMLTTLSDNSIMWAYFNVPEARYLAYQNNPEKNNVKIELMLADGTIFPQVGKIGAIEADFNNETGNIAFRGDFANPGHLLRHGQTGTVLLSRIVKNAIVIPQRATFEILAKKYAYVVGNDHIVRQREITILNEQDDIFLIKSGLEVNDKIILEGIRQVRDGEKVVYDFRAPEEVLSNLKLHAE